MRKLDLLTWEVMRVNFFITAFFLRLIIPYINNPKLSHKIHHQILSCEVLQTMSLDDLPNVARVRMLNQGRMLIALIIFIQVIGAFH